MTDLATDYASRIREACDIIRTLGPDRRNPHQFLEDKDAALKSLEQLADEVQLEQVFVKLPSHPVPVRVTLPAEPRTVRDRRGRAVPVEVRRKRVLAR